MYDLANVTPSSLFGIQGASQGARILLSLLERLFEIKIFGDSFVLALSLKKSFSLLGKQAKKLMTHPALTNFLSNQMHSIRKSPSTLKPASKSAFVAVMYLTFY